MTEIIEMYFFNKRISLFSIKKKDVYFSDRLDTPELKPKKL